MPDRNDKPDWPAARDDPAEELEVFKAKVAEVAAARARLDAASDPRCDEIDDRFADAYYGILKARVDQSRSSVETLQRSAAAIAGLYSAVLGVAFSVADRPLPLRGLLPLVFIGIAAVTSTVHLAWQGGGKEAIPTAHPETRIDGFERQRAYIWDFAAVVGEFLRRRLSWLRASVVAIAIGLVLIPVPFVEVDTGDAAPAEVSSDDAQAAPEPVTVLPPWPEPPGEVRGDSRAFQLALYEAELAEISRQRAAVLDRDSDEAPHAASLRLPWVPESGWAIVAAILLGTVAVIAVVPQGRYSAPGGPGQSSQQARQPDSEPSPGSGSSRRGRRRTRRST